MNEVFPAWRDNIEVYVTSHLSRQVPRESEGTFSLRAREAGGEAREEGGGRGREGWRADEEEEQGEPDQGANCLEPAAELELGSFELVMAPYSPLCLIRPLSEAASSLHSRGRARHGHYIFY